MHTHFGAIWEAIADAAPDQAAVVQGERRVSWREYDQRAAGRYFDEVLLHTFFTDETLQRCVRTVKESAEQAGRDPSTVKVWSCSATIGDWLPEDVQLKKTVGRLATYLQAYGDLMVRTK